MGCASQCDSYCLRPSPLLCVKYHGHYNSTSSGGLCPERLDLRGLLITGPESSVFALLREQVGFYIPVVLLLFIVLACISPLSHSSIHCQSWCLCCFVSG
eukprot:TRINITY_DN69646_c0_g1_i6.p3 TRINITY_DN69646_c0_g1~~TRINITY_DN69646_c0_g1_i6.p3  ORF type:complete len:100 (+),score=4.78 TRINITY_DN69646_c0_g1_i6:525-824(+)